MWACLFYGFLLFSIKYAIHFTYIWLIFVMRIFMLFYFSFQVVALLRCFSACIKCYCMPPLMPTMMVIRELNV